MSVQGIAVKGRERNKNECESKRCCRRCNHTRTSGRHLSFFRMWVFDSHMQGKNIKSGKDIFFRRSFLVSLWTPKLSGRENRIEFDSCWPDIYLQKQTKKLKSKSAGSTGGERGVIITALYNCILSERRTNIAIFGAWGAGAHSVSR